MSKHTLILHTQDKTMMFRFSGTPRLMDVLQAEGVAFAHPCGGRGTCRKCAVDVLGAVSAPDEIEQKSGLRLSCRLRLIGDCEVTLKELTGFARQEELQPFTGAALLAADIGTTTLEIKLFDADSGTLMRHATALNPQAGYAADVIGRITAATEGKGEAMREGLEYELLGMTGTGSAIEKAVITGNTVMLYLLTGRNPEALAAAPFAADHLFGQTEQALGMPVYLPPCTGAFTGADLTCAVLYSGMTDKAETGLLCDVGTNGEIALWHQGKLYITSTAVGPAFEGAGISCGMGGEDGAIDKVWAAQGVPDVRVIGSGQPKGICGSGLIDAVAVLLQLCLIDQSGAMDADSVQIKGGIALTRQDIRQVQLAKAAVAAGIQLLMDAAGADARDIQTLYIAGGFGSHLDVRSAAAIGLFPAVLVQKAQVLGNAALEGACMLLMDEKLQQKAGDIARAAESILLSGNPLFSEAFIGHMNF